MKLQNNIYCTGVLEKKDFEEVKCYDIFKQVITNNIFEIPAQKPEAESISNVSAQAVITRWRIIDSIHGKKVVFHGEIRITVTYVANKPEQPVHSVHFNQNFYGYINCDVLCNNICESFKIKAFIEDIESCLVCERKIDITTIVLIVVKNCCIKDCHKNHHFEDVPHDSPHLEDALHDELNCEEHNDEHLFEGNLNEQTESDIRNKMREKRKERN